MYGPATLEKRKIGKIFIVNNHIPSSPYNGSGCPYSGQKYVPSFVSSQDLVYRSTTRLIHKIHCIRAEVSDKKPLIILISIFKYITAAINTGRQIHWHWVQIQVGNNPKVSKASRTGILLFNSMRDLVLANKIPCLSSQMLPWVKFGHREAKALVRLISKDA